jgi:hypothetical protein
MEVLEQKRGQPLWDYQDALRGWFFGADAEDPLIQLVYSSALSALNFKAITIELLKDAGIWHEEIETIADPS